MLAGVLLMGLFGVFAFFASEQYWHWFPTAARPWICRSCSIGARCATCWLRHMLPNGVAPIRVAASFGVASAILAEATLSFLGLGLVDDPSWGQMLNQAVRSSTFNWWLAVFPGGAIFLTVFTYNLIGESLCDAIDPYLKRAAA